jgi:hypothetical protein
MLLWLEVWAEQLSQPFRYWILCSLWSCCPPSEGMVRALE